METAVSLFFGLKLSQAAKHLDQAYIEARNLPNIDQSFWSAANQFAIDFESHFLDSKSQTLRFRMRRVYGIDVATEKTIKNSVSFFPGTLRLELIRADGECVAKNTWPEFAGPSISGHDIQQEDETAIESEWYSWSIPNVEPGWLDVRAVCFSDFQEAEIIAERVSFLADLPNRIQKVDEWYAANRRAQGTTQHATARWLAKELTQAAHGTTTETDFPWNQWFDDFEFLRDENRTISDWIKSSRATDQISSGQRSYWVVLSEGKQNQIARLEVPSFDRGPFPVVFAFHGAGGSENMFFESYGAGRLIELARERGWLVVAPRQGLGGLSMDISQMLASLQEFLPIDSQRVALVGHSMGAAQSIAQVSKHADHVHAVAALGGGGSPRPSDVLTHVPFFVAAGERDFGRSRAKSLCSQLKTLGAQVEYREYPDVEHMVIVQAALDDVFHFLDNALKP